MDARFKIGQTVWTAEAVDKAVYVECPDCKGSQKWIATSPVGENFEFPCPRCTRHDVWKLANHTSVATTRKLTIGSVRIDTADRDSPVSYMCHETGVGSGTVWRETRLAATEEEATVLGRAAVADREKWRIEQVTRNERNSGGQNIEGKLRAAVQYLSWTTAEITDARSRQWAAEYRLENLCNAIAELDEYGGIEGLDLPTLDRIIEHLDDDCPGVGKAREAVLYDREKARKAA